MGGAAPAAPFFGFGAMREISVRNESRPLQTPLRAGFCTSYWCKLRGLTFRRSLPPGWGLLLVYNRDSRLDAAITMLGVWIDLGIVWINGAGEVVDARVAKRWLSNLAPKRPARYVLEIVPERLKEFQIGDKVRFDTLS